MATYFIMIKNKGFQMVKSTEAVKISEDVIKDNEKWKSLENFSLHSDRHP